MRCTCGAEGTLFTKRRDFPYCRNCFTQHIIRSARKDAGEGPILLRPASATGDDAEQLWLAAARAAAAAAGREVILDPKGMRSGCAEIAAAEGLRTVFGQSQEHLSVFPRSLTFEELQLFYSPLATVTLEQLPEELRQLEDRYPGTVASVLRSVADRTP